MDNKINTSEIITYLRLYLIANDRSNWAAKAMVNMHKRTFTIGMQAQEFIDIYNYVVKTIEDKKYRKNTGKIAIGVALQHINDAGILDTGFDRDIVGSLFDNFKIF